MHELEVMLQRSWATANQTSANIGSSLISHFSNKKKPPPITKDNGRNSNTKMMETCTILLLLRHDFEQMCIKFNPSESVRSLKNQFESEAATFRTAIQQIRDQYEVPHFSCLLSNFLHFFPLP
jgi:hypothetical protein